MKMLVNAHQAPHVICNINPIGNSKLNVIVLLSTMSALNAENYSRGFLVDEELMAGVTQHPDQPDTFVAFVLQHSTGEYLGYQPYPSLDQALSRINQIPRPWTFERVGGGCAGGKCGTAEGGCGGGGCKAGKCGTGDGTCPI
jgi:hypothetical protein